MELAWLLDAAEELADMGSWALDLEAGTTLWSPGMYRVLGRAPLDEAQTDQMVLGAVHPADRAQIGSLLQSVTEDPGSIPPEGLTAEFRLVRPDGTARQVRARGRVERDASGRPVRWVGALHDVTEQRLAERELHAHYAVAQALRDWETFDEGVVGLLRRVGTALEHPVGSLWLWDADDGRLGCRAFWSATGVPVDAFERAERGRRLRPGDGQAGLVWQQQRPVLTPNLAAGPLARCAEPALAVGLRSALAFPAVAPQGTVAVLGFYSFERQVPSANLLQTLSSIGRELGRFLGARRAQLQPGRLTGRELEVLRLAAEGQSGPAIAECLGVSLSTIKTHFEHTYEKLGVGDRAAAVAEGLRSGLIQ
jgi:PAS domain S-box-containing protein